MSGCHRRAATNHKAACGEVGSSAAASLAELVTMEDEEASVRAAAAEALGRVGAMDQKEALAAALVAPVRCDGVDCERARLGLIHEQIQNT